MQIRIRSEEVLKIHALAYRERERETVCALGQAQTLAASQVAALSVPWPAARVVETRRARFPPRQRRAARLRAGFYM